MIAIGIEVHAVLSATPSAPAVQPTSIRRYTGARRLFGPYLRMRRGGVDEPCIYAPREFEDATDDIIPGRLI